MKQICKYGCEVTYSEITKDLPGGEKVLFKIESITRCKGMSDDDMKIFLNYMEGKINTEILIRTEAESLHQQYPHFYFDKDKENDKEFDLMKNYFHMKPIDALGIILYPGREIKKEE